MHSPKLPKGMHGKIAQELGISVTALRNYLSGSELPPRNVMRVVVRHRELHEDKQRVLAFRNMVRRSSNEQLLTLLRDQEADRSRAAVLKCFVEVDLIGGAFDYYAGRATISAGDFAFHLKEAWPHLAPGTQHMLRRRLLSLFGKHAEQLRQVMRGERMTHALALGMKDDVACWETLRLAIAKYDATSEGQMRLAQFPGPPAPAAPAGYASQADADSATIFAIYAALAGRADIDGNISSTSLAEAASQANIAA